MNLETNLMNNAGVSWSLSILNLPDMSPVAEYNLDQPLRTASVPKILLLHEVASRVADGRLNGNMMLSRPPEPVGGSGIWQHLNVDSMSVLDASALVGISSDNLATNALLDIIGLESLTRSSQKLGLRVTHLNDYVRAERIPDVHSQTVSQGTARELATLCATEDRLSQSDPVSGQLIEWLSKGADHSMVLSPLMLDPLSDHYHPDGDFRVWNKTGTDDGVRADVGVVHGPRGSVAYAVIVNWEPELTEASEALLNMRRIGEQIRIICAGM